MSFHQVVEVILCCDLSIGKEMVPIMKEYCSFYPKYLKAQYAAAEFLKDQGLSLCVPVGKSKEYHSDFSSGLLVSIGRSGQVERQQWLIAINYASPPQPCLLKSTLCESIWPPMYRGNEHN